MTINYHAALLKAILIDDQTIDYKGFFRRMCERHPEMVLNMEYPHVAIQAEPAPMDANEQVLGECLTLSLKNKKVAAIKRWRDHFGVGLKEAKDAVDELDNRYYPGDEMRLARVIVEGRAYEAADVFTERFGHDEGTRQFNNLYRKVTEHIHKYPAD